MTENYTADVRDVDDGFAASAAYEKETRASVAKKLDKPTANPTTTQMLVMKADGTTATQTIPTTVSGTSVLTLTKVGGVWYRDYGANSQATFTPPATSTDGFWAAFPVILVAMPEATSVSEVPAWVPDRASVDMPVAAAVAG